MTTQQMADLVLAAACTVLFVYAAAVGLARLFRRPAGGLPGTGRQAARPDARGQRLAAAGALLWALAMLAALCAAACAQYPGVPPLQAVRQALCGGLDARHYLDLAPLGLRRRGGRLCRAVPDDRVFPLWPWLLRLFALLGADLWLTGTLLAVALTAAGTVLLYRCAFRLFGSGRAAGFACAVQLLLPGSFFFVLPQTEALFFCLNFAFLDAMQRDKPGPAGLFGLLASLCRANGVLLAGYAVLWWVAELRRGAAVFGPVAAAGGRACGGAGGVFGHQLGGVRQRFPVYRLPAGTLGSQLLPVPPGGGDHEPLHLRRQSGHFYRLWTVVLILLEVLLLALAARRLPPDWLAAGPGRRCHDERPDLADQRPAVCTGDAGAGPRGCRVDETAVAARGAAGRAGGFVGRLLCRLCRARAHLLTRRPRLPGTPSAQYGRKYAKKHRHSLKQRLCRCLLYGVDWRMRPVQPRLRRALG